MIRTRATIRFLKVKNGGHTKPFVSGDKAQTIPVFPKVPWFEDSNRGNDARDEVRRGDVEARVEGHAGWVGDSKVLKSAWNAA